MPLYAAAAGYKNKYRYHMPGHKGKFFKCAEIDITELSFSGNLFGGGDDVISRAEKLCAESYGAKAVKFSTCGTTVNILSLLYGVKDKGKLIIQKNSHISVYNALKLCGIEPVIIDCRQSGGIYSPVTAGQIENALKSGGCFGALVTSPDYYGRAADLKEIKRALGKRLLIVDAAHGGHLPFIFKGFFKAADVYFCSAHKNLPSLTPAAFTAFNDISLFDGFVQSLRIFHTSSPSFAALASIDYAREYMRVSGAEKLNTLKELSEKYKALIDGLGYKLKENFDFTKLIISHDDIGGFDLYDLLENEGLYLETCDDENALALFTVADGEREYKKLYNALKKISEKLQKGGISARKEKTAASQFDLRAEMPYLEAANSPCDKVDIQNAAGRVASRDVGLYPPGFPLICCGERYTSDLCRYLLKNKSRLFGVDNGGVFVVK